MLTRLQIARVFLAFLGCSLGLTTHANVIYLSNYNANSIIKIENGISSTLASGLNGPTDLALDGLGNLFCANTGGDSILKITQDGTVSTFASSLGEVEFLAFAPNGDLYASNGDAGHSAYYIKKITPAGIVSSVSFVSRPNGLAFGSDGNLYNVDYGHAPSFVYRITPTLTGFATLSGSNAHGRGFDMAFNGTDAFYCTDDISGIEKISATGVESDLVTTPLQCIGITTDGTGDIYASGSAVYRITPAGVITTVPLGGASGFFQGIAVAVPEPSSFAALAAVGFALTARCRRHR